MQGDLQEINISSLIKFLELNQQTGILLIETTTPSILISQTSNETHNYFNSKPSCSLRSLSQPQSWLTFFRDGKIIYITNNKESSLLQLKDYFYYNLSEKILNCLDKTLENFPNALEYFYLRALLHQDIITPSKAKKILKNILTENLFQVSKLTQGNFVFQSSQIELSTFVNFHSSGLVNLVLKELQNWYKLIPYIYSETQYFSNCNQEKLKKNLPIDIYQKIIDWIEHKTSLLQASRHLNCSVVDLAKAVYPYLKKSWIKLLADDSYDYLKQSVNSHHKTSHIIYIDNDVTNGKNVEYILKQRSYKLTVVQDSIEALSLILKIQPDAILCNIDMPQLNGEKLYFMLQNSQIGGEMPVILVAERKDVLAIEKAKLVCNADYLIKPFVNDELITVLEKYLKATKQKQLNLIS